MEGPGRSDMKGTMHTSRKGHAVVILALVTICIFGSVVRLNLILGSLPYPRHTDEKLILWRAQVMLHTGDLNPHWFKYPTLPTHLTAACLTVGYLYACSQLELKSVSEIGSVVYPYYTHPNVVLPAKLLFSLLSILSLVFVGLIGLRAFGRRSLLFLIPLSLSMSSLYLQQSWSYLNVDIVGCFFVMCVMLLLFRDLDEKGVFRRCIVLGVLCGLTISSKYSLFLIALPCSLHLLLYDWKRWPARCLIVIGAMIVTLLPGGAGSRGFQGIP